MQVENYTNWDFEEHSTFQKSFNFSKILLQDIWKSAAEGPQIVELHFEALLECPLIKSDARK